VGSPRRGEGEGRRAETKSRRKELITRAVRRVKNKHRGKSEERLKSSSSKSRAGPWAIVHVSTLRFLGSTVLGKRHRGFGSSPVPIKDVHSFEERGTELVVVPAGGSEYLRVDPDQESSVPQRRSCQAFKRFKNG